ncbi:transglutaminase domain-containing protein [Anaerocolumna jejuensis]|uniref:transglutaminase domain-containing protein n=1 Tax=Anaerocolumna jejuensis TaxID=259063 RepID=UPI003F7CB713
MKIKKISIFIFAFFITLFFSTNYSLISSSAATSGAIALNTTTSYLVKGETTVLKVTGISAKATWTSRNKRIANISSSGKVTAITYGTTTVVATVNNKSYSCKVIVVDPSELYLKPSAEIIMVGGKEVTLNPQSYLYSTAAIQKMGITYGITGNDSIKISSAGEVTAAKAGKFKVTAYIHGKKIGTVSITADDFKGFSDSEANVAVEDTKEIYFADNYKLYDKLYNEDVNVTSSDPKVVDVKLAYSVENLDYYYGIKITGVADGTAIVSVNVSGVTRQIKVIVGIGTTILAPVDAVKTGNYTGYTGNSLETLKWVRQFIDSNNLLSASVTDREKVTIIQNYFMKNFNSNVSDSVYNGNVSRLLLDGDGHCDSYATAFCFLCDCINLPCFYVGGAADNGNGNGFVGHAWNKVKIDGTWYYIDTYWCAGLHSLDKYFLSTGLWSDHELDEEGYYPDIIVSSYAPYINDLW